MFGVFIQPGFTDLSQNYRGVAPATTNNANAQNVVTISGVQYQVTADNMTTLVNLRYKQREMELGRPLTTEEKGTISAAFRTLLTSLQKGADSAPTTDLISGANIAPDFRTDPHGVFIDGKGYIVTRDNVADLVALRIQEKQKNGPVSDADKKAIAQALANLATDAGPQDANPSVSTYQIALDGIRRAANVIAGTGSVGPNSLLGRTLSILDIAGYATLLWAGAQLLKAKG